MRNNKYNFEIEVTRHTYHTALTKTGIATHLSLKIKHVSKNIKIF